MDDIKAVRAEIKKINRQRIRPTDYLGLSEVCYEEGFNDAGKIAMDAYRCGSRGPRFLDMIEALLETSKPKRAQFLPELPKEVEEP